MHPSTSSAATQAIGEEGREKSPASTEQSFFRYFLVSVPRVHFAQAAISFLTNLADSALIAMDNHPWGHTDTAGAHCAVSQIMESEPYF